MNFYRNNIVKIAAAALLASVISGCGSSSSKKPAFETSELFLDFSLPFSILEQSLPDVSGITFNNEEDYYLLSSAAGDLLFLSTAGEVLESLTVPSALTGIEFTTAGNFLLSDTSRVLTFNTESQNIEVLYDFTDQYDSIQAIAYREETEEIFFVNNGKKPVLVFINTQGEITEIALDSQFNNYDIDGLQLSEDYIYMGSPGYKRDKVEDRQSVVIKTEFDGSFVQAWSLDEKVLTGIAIIDENKPEFITTNLGEDGSFNLYEPEALPSVPSEQPLAIQGAIELNFNQPSGIDYLISNNTFYYITDFGEIRSGNAEGINILLFEIETQQGSYEAIAASVNDNNVELHVINSDDSLAKTTIEKYTVAGELLEAFELSLIQGEHLFESLDFSQESNRYYTVNSNEESRKYLYTVENGTTETLELPTDYDEYYISGLDYSENSGYLYLVTEEFEDQNGKNAGLLIIYDTENSTEIDRYSIVDATEPTIGLENPSGVTINSDESEIYITSDIDDSLLHHYLIDTE